MSEKKVRELSRKLETIAFVMLDLEEEIKYLVRKLDPGVHPAGMTYADRALSRARHARREDILREQERERKIIFYRMIGFDPMEKMPTCPGCSMPLGWSKAHDQLDFDSEVAGEIRGYMARLMGDCMENWMECTECAEKQPLAVVRSAPDSGPG